MKALIITKTITVYRPKPTTFTKGQIFLLTEFLVFQFETMCYKLRIDKDSFSKLISTADIIKDYNEASVNIIIQRTGGIGDLIALSSVSKYLKLEGCSITFLTTTKYKPLFKWFDEPINFWDYESPLWFKNDVRFQLNNYLGLLEYEGKIEANNKNWFHTFFEPLHECIDYNTWGRPQLKTKRISNINKRVNGILLCLKASSNIRSIAFEPVYKSLNTKEPLFVHDSNLTEVDRKFISDNNVKIEVLIQTDLSQFLLDCYDATMVISTDTGALHFREGVGKPVLGIYNSFTSECRTKYYKHSKTIDIKSDCLFQPCFIHTQRPSYPCKNPNYCMDHNINKSLISQLTTFFKENL